MHKRVQYYPPMTGGIQEIKMKIGLQIELISNEVLLVNLKHLILYTKI